MNHAQQMPVEDIEDLAEAAPRHIRLEFLNGRVRTKEPLNVEDFEELERRAPETVRLEYVNGKLEVKARQDGNHSCIHAWLTHLFLLRRPGHGLYSFVGVKTQAARNGRAVADGAFAQRGHFKGHGEWSDPDGILMTVEITVRDHDTNRRARIDKPIGYAEAGIPVHLLIDRDDQTLTVFSEPEEGRYQQSLSYPWGSPVPLPDPVGFTLDTEELKDYAD